MGRVRKESDVSNPISFERCLASTARYIILMNFVTNVTHKKVSASFLYRLLLNEFGLVKIVC